MKRSDTANRTKKCSRGKLAVMDRVGSFFLGVVAGALVVLGVQRLLDGRGLSLESLEDSIEEKLDALEGAFAEPILN